MNVAISLAVPARQSLEGSCGTRRFVGWREPLVGLVMLQLVGSSIAVANVARAQGARSSGIAPRSCHAMTYATDASGVVVGGGGTAWRLVAAQAP